MKHPKRFAVLVVVAVVLLLLAFTAATAPTSNAQTTVKATASPVPTAISTGGLWLYMGHGQTIQGECAPGSEPTYYTQDTQWQIVCMPTGS